MDLASYNTTTLRRLIYQIGFHILQANDLLSIAYVHAEMLK
jgi:hypothetical protein